MADTSKTPVARLRAALSTPGNIIISPGVYDGLTARIALKAGFDCLYMTGAGTTMSRLGMPDLGIATLNDMRDNAAMIASLDTSIPLVADADTGFGGPLMVGRTVSQYMRAGVAALHLEDQVQSKRCGHLMNKELASEDEFLSRIRAAVQAREKEKGDIVIIAGTDALETLGYDAARDRLRKALDIGADVAFLEGIKTKDQGRKICEGMAPTPCLYNCVPGGVSPVLSVQEAQHLGYRMIILPAFALGPVYEAVEEAARFLRDTGISAESKTKASPKDVFTVCGLAECIAFDLAAGGMSFSKGV
ncbi:putative carboxyphosphonoenolpyruvate mutase [Daldinia caldariorum]|uniref:putative carboxyphosphonoenolpyruvate mutase n=1 Tax=Daldinia caldariorum TaxID=326644 RepID=UPI002008BAE3|nr:putative carboxyphosphonoenolpyruvate mutase [Daldinia caldariorum]KAI1469830.1 putative carboxyphosphonoenolpyruvate mutase [Daldinia caldariorum]